MKKWKKKKKQRPRRRRTRVVIINTKVYQVGGWTEEGVLYFLDIIIGGCNTIPVIQGSSMKIKIIIIKKMKQTNNNILLYILTKEEVLSIEFTPYYTPCSLLMYTIHHQSDRCLKSFRPMLNYWSIQAIQCHTNVHDLSPHGPLSH